ncbi:MAG TPA: hypothetical protein VMU75_07660 [Acidimicrobiales bacterium]|nr:hypothetical protein [Acidimicrobiales bacterium]
MSNLVCYPATGGIELSVAEPAVFPLPLGDGPQPVADKEGAPSCSGHPRRDADAFLRRRRENLVVHVCVNGNCEFG